MENETVLELVLSTAATGDAIVAFQTGDIDTDVFEQTVDWSNAACDQYLTEIDAEFDPYLWLV